MPFKHLTSLIWESKIVTNLVSHKMKEEMAMPRTEEAKQRIRDEQRTKILEAAKRVFARKGLAATVDDVAAEAAVSHGLAYRYFANKEAMFTALVVQALQAPSAALQRYLEQPGTPGERLAFLISGLMTSRKDPEAYLLLDQVLSSETMPGELRELVQRRGQEMQRVLRQLIVEAQESFEVVRCDPDQLVRVILASLEGLTRQALYDREHYHEHFPEADILLCLLKP
jgi:AcrR family transcriptional regulator